MLSTISVLSELRRGCPCLQQLGKRVFASTSEKGWVTWWKKRWSTKCSGVLRYFGGVLVNYLRCDFQRFTNVVVI